MATSDEIKKLNEEISKIARQLGKGGFKVFNANEIDEAKAALLGLKTELQEIVSDTNNLAGAFRASINEINNSKSAINETNKSLRGLESIAKKLSYDYEGISKLSLKELDTLKKQAAQKEDDFKKSLDSLKSRRQFLESEQSLNKKSGEELKRIRAAEAAINSEIKDSASLIKNLNTILDDRIEKETQIQKNLGISGAILKGIEGTMNKVGLGALSQAVGFNKINEELEEYAASLEEGDEKFSDSTKQTMVMNKGIEMVGDSIKTALTDPFVLLQISLQIATKLISSIADGFKRSQENTSELAKNLNISNEEAMGLSQEMSKASFGSDALFLSSKGLTETLVEINKELGTSVQLTTEELATFTKLRETAGLTNEELMGIQKLSLANGDSFDKNADSLLNQVSSLNRASGIFLNEKEVLKDISKLSAATTLSLGKNPKALAEAAATAKAFGMEMSKVEAIAGSLLDFESSIESELEAELLLGKNINLEKARQAALNNDLATVAKEIADQAGSAAEFAEMNRIQQEALAKSVGMSREDLAQTLFVQEQLAGASKEEAERRQKLLDARIEEVGLAQAQRELEEGGLENMLNQATATEKMEASLGKIQELFTSIGALFAPVVDMFASVAGYIAESKTAMVILSGVIGGVLAATSALAVKSLIVAVPKIFGTLISTLGPFGIPAAIGAVALMASTISSMKAKAVGDLSIDPNGGPIVMSPNEGGLFQGTKNDALRMGPKDALDSTSTTNQVVMENKEAKETNELLRQILTKQGTVTMDSTEVGTAFAMSSYQVQ